MLIVDTGVLVATADRSDPEHALCRSLLEDDDGPLVTTGLVVAEAAYLIDRQVGPDGEVGSAAFQRRPSRPHRRLRTPAGRYVTDGRTA